MLLQETRIEEWPDTHPDWPALMACVQAEDQLNWVNFSAEFHRSSHMVVALWHEEVIGFLRLVTQEIGSDMDASSVLYRGEVLIEAKILAFGVKPDYRRQGIGRALQTAAIDLARRLGCYQLRSHSSGWNKANHQLKLSMGFGVHPEIRGEDRAGAYFVMPLWQPQDQDVRTERLSRSEVVPPRRQTRSRERLQRWQEEE
jgi:GNAT superfamily N-acetyltransferase